LVAFFLCVLGGTPEAQAVPVIRGTGISAAIGFTFGEAIADQAVAIAEAEAVSTDGDTATATTAEADFLDPYTAFAEATSEASATFGSNPEIWGTSFASVMFTNETDDLITDIISSTVLSQLTISALDTGSNNSVIIGEGYVEVALIFADGTSELLLSDSASARVEGDGTDGFAILGENMVIVAELQPGDRLVATASVSYHGALIPEPSGATLFALGSLLVSCRIRHRSRAGAGSPPGGAGRAGR
jgi:hypothetical protein